ncbi:MAG: hypothetical protein RIS17_986, partial [Pseudomonadota bacterium]
MLATTSLPLLAGAPAFAQDAQPAAKAEAAEGEIIVTARKREETMLDVPVAMSALGGDDLQRYAASDFGGIANQVPGLLIVPIPGGAGGSVALRGVTSSASNPAIDQAVALNIDGVQVGSANYLRLSQIDLQQIEVLKGPQALFFGKNSPGGVISIRTADPKDYFEGSVSMGYEFNAREWTGQAMVSGPLAENLKGRLVVYGNKMRGWMNNNAKAYTGFTFGPESGHAPDAKEIYARGTLLFDPTDDLNIRLKYGYSNRKASSPYALQQRIACPYGTAQTLGYPGAVECKQDDNNYTGKPDPRAEAANPYLYHGDFGKTQQHLASLEMSYSVTPEISLTSVTGYFDIKDKFNGSASYQHGTPLIAGTYVNRREFSQELRLNTDFRDAPVNLTLGAYYQDLGFKQRVPLAIDLFAFGATAAPGLGWSQSDNRFRMSGSTWSMFGQARWDIVDNLELAGGVRYTKEKKSFSIATLTDTDAIPLNPKIKFSNWSPEATLTYKVSPKLSVFGAYRVGYKSGGYNSGGGSYTDGIKNDYAPEKVRGFEAGVKTVQGPVRFNLTAYSYKYQDMQVSTFDPATITQTVVNAASARIKGVEADIQWRTPVEGLSLRSTLNYNKARYSEFFVGCYTGQTIAQGCNLNLVNGQYRQQDFKGRQLMLAPDWTGNTGFTFETPVGGSLKLTLTGDMNYSSSFFGQLEEAPLAKQKNFTMFDASLRVGDADDRWEVALMGRNLSDVYRSRFVSQTSFTGRSAYTGTNTTGGLADYSGIVNRG